jgi:hypothetical protein
METVLQGIRDGTVPSAGPHLRLLLRLLDVFRGGVAALSMANPRQSPAAPACSTARRNAAHGGIAAK